MTEPKPGSRWGRKRRRVYFDGDRALVPLANARGTAVVDIDLAHRVTGISWSLHPGGYAASKRDGKSVYMHRLLVGAASDAVVDHANWDTLDNRISNIRTCTPLLNTARKRSSAKSGYRGVKRSGDSPRARWCAQLKMTGADGTRKNRYIGTYETLLEAAAAYDIAATAEYGEFAVLNFPNGAPEELRNPTKVHGNPLIAVCKNGHEMKGDNVAVAPNGGRARRWCRACKRAASCRRRMLRERLREVA